jgi:hypothetical protein
MASTQEPRHGEYTGATAWQVHTRSHGMLASAQEPRHGKYTGATAWRVHRSHGMESCNCTGATA